MPSSTDTGSMPLVIYLLLLTPEDLRFFAYKTRLCIALIRRPPSIQHQEERHAILHRAPSNTNALCTFPLPPPVPSPPLLAPGRAAKEVWTRTRTHKNRGQNKYITQYFLVGVAFAPCGMCGMRRGKHMSKKQKSGCGSYVRRLLHKHEIVSWNFFHRRQFISSASPASDEHRLDSFGKRVTRPFMTFLLPQAKSVQRK